MVTAKVAEQVSTVEAQPGTPVAANGQSGGVKATEQSARDHVWIHMLPWAEFESEHLRIFDRGEGARLYDIQGREYLDGIAGLWVVNAGHGRREIGDAIAEQAARSPTSRRRRTPRLRRCSWPTNSPSSRPAISTASSSAPAARRRSRPRIKIAKQVQAMRGFPKRYKIIARRGSYHGMTYGAMSLHRHAQREPTSARSCTASTTSRLRTTTAPTSVSTAKRPTSWRAKYVEQEIVIQGPETVAAVIGEPISIADGVHVPSPKYWQRLREICDKHGVLLITDEVINGFGRTGKMFATEHFGMRAGHDDDGQGPLLRLRADRRRRRARVGLRRLQGKEEASGPPADLRRPGRRLRGGAEEHRDLQARESRRNRVRRRATTCRSVSRSCAPTRPSATCAASASSAVSSMVKNKETQESWGKSTFTNAGQLLQERGMLTRVWDVLHFAPPLVATSEEIDRIVTITDESLTIAEQEFASDIVA